MLSFYFGRRFVQLFLIFVIIGNIYVITIQFLSFEKQTTLMLKKRVTVLGDNKEKIDWHDYEFIKYEADRKGPGEQGKPHFLEEKAGIKEDKLSIYKLGFAQEISDQISPNRSVPDIRLDICKTKKYLKNLPKTSVIVIFYNEEWSLLLRCLHSVWNRTPSKLLHEIILYDDCSTGSDLFDTLKDYIDENFNEKVKLFKNNEREGLIRTRMNGAKAATGDVIVFLDSHIEVNVNWLPPLLEPIALNPKTATVPIIDSLSPFTFEYELLGHGTRGGFDWDLTFQWMPLREQDVKHPGEPFDYPVMTGGAYAIRRDFFFDLGGYDEGMLLWNGENYEMSWKIWLCGGKMLQVPCSHVAHTSKLFVHPKQDLKGLDYSARNLKRVAEVWMDDYKHELFMSNPHRYEVDAGDLREAYALKKRLQCKPFQYFLDVVAPEICERYPPSHFGVFANGAIVSDADPSLCITYAFNGLENPLELEICSSSKTNPEFGQNFRHDWRRSIQFHADKWKCLDSMSLNLIDCHLKFGSQIWKYSLETHQLENIPFKTCISGNTETRILTLQPCNATDIYQKFSWGYTNTSAYTNWDTYGIKIPSSIET